MNDNYTVSNSSEQDKFENDLVEVSKRGLMLGRLFLAIIFMFIGVVLKTSLDGELTNFVTIMFTVTTLGTACLYLSDNRKRDKLFKKLHER